MLLFLLLLLLLLLLLFLHLPAKRNMLDSLLIAHHSDPKQKRCLGSFAVRV